MRAAYDYVPSTDSPNDTVEEELPFREGDVLLVYGRMDDDGFYQVSWAGSRVCYMLILPPPFPPCLPASLTHSSLSPSLSRSFPPSLPSSLLSPSSLSLSLAPSPVPHSLTQAELKGKKGLVPSTFLEELVSPEQTPERELPTGSDPQVRELTGLTAALHNSAETSVFTCLTCFTSQT